jgi:hypothetical protein
MSSRELPKMPSYFDATEHPTKSTIRQIKKAHHHKTILSENLIEKSSISNPRFTSSDNYGDGYVSSIDGGKREGHPWLSGFWRRMPTLAVLALLMVPLCAGADAVILYKSDGKEVESWKVSPSVLLAILSAVANVCLQFARSEGVVISWWRKALRGGTLRDLSRYWESGDSILAALAPGRGFNVVALATLAAQAVILDGPLLQRASTVVSKQVTRSVNVTAAIAQEIPYGYTGYGSFAGNSSYFGGPAIMVMNVTFAEIFNQYLTRSPITTTFTGCVGSCVGTIKAAGLALECSEESIPWSNLWSNLTNVSTEYTVFSSTFEWQPASHLGELPDPAAQIDPASLYPYINFNLSYAIGRIATPSLSNGLPYGTPQGTQIPWTCNGTMITKHCSMRSATLDYPITLVNNTVHLSGNSSSFSVDHIQAVGNISDFFEDHDPDTMTFTTLGGIAVAAQNMFNSQAVQQQGVSLTGSLASQYIDYGTGPTNFFINQDACAINWVDPSDDIINALNELMFRTSLIASNVSKYALMNDRLDGYTKSVRSLSCECFCRRHWHSGPSNGRNATDL